MLTPLLNYWGGGSGSKGYVDPPLKLLGGGLPTPPLFLRLLNLDPILEQFVVQKCLKKNKMPTDFRRVHLL